MQMTKQRKTEKNQFCHKIKSHDATFIIIMPCQVKNEMEQTCWMFLNFSLFIAFIKNDYFLIVYNYIMNLILKWMRRIKVPLFRLINSKEHPQYIFLFTFCFSLIFFAYSCHSIIDFYSHVLHLFIRMCFYFFMFFYPSFKLNDLPNMYL